MAGSAMRGICRSDFVEEIDESWVEKVLVHVDGIQLVVAAMHADKLTLGAGSNLLVNGSVLEARSL